MFFSVELWRLNKKEDFLPNFTVKIIEMSYALDVILKALNLVSSVNR